MMKFETNLGGNDDTITRGMILYNNINQSQYDVIYEMIYDE